MACPVTAGVPCKCTFGTLPGVLTPTGQTQTLACTMPVATTADVTVTTFGMCSNPNNPAVASATAAAAGVLTPQPCVPVPNGVWLPGSATVSVGGKPVLNDSSKLLCAYLGGVISVLAATAKTVKVP